MLYASNDCSTIRDLFFCVRAGCKIQLVSYGSKHSLKFFLVSHLCVLTHLTCELQVTYVRSAYWMSGLLSDTFLVWFTVARDPTRELWLQTCISQSLSDTNLCAYTASLYIYITIWCATTDDNWNSCTLWLHITHQMTALLPMMHLFQEQSWLATLHVRATSNFG